MRYSDYDRQRACLPLPPLSPLPSHSPSPSLARILLRLPSLSPSVAIAARYPLPLLATLSLSLPWCRGEGWSWRPETKGGGSRRRWWAGAVEGRGRGREVGKGATTSMAEESSLPPRALLVSRWGGGAADRRKMLMPLTLSARRGMCRGRWQAPPWPGCPPPSSSRRLPPQTRPSGRRRRLQGEQGARAPPPASRVAPPLPSSAGEPLRR